MPSPTKLYAYVDESGQETEGRLFVVGVVVTGTERDTLLGQLEALETQSSKRKAKWQRSRPLYRQAYITGLTQIALLKGSLFHTRFTQGGAYTDLTAEATARAIQAKAQGTYRVTISVDGLNRVEGRIFAKRLRSLGIGPRKIRGVRNEKSDAGIRLADALCGLVRDAEEGQDWAREALGRLQRIGYMTEV